LLLLATSVLLLGLADSILKGFGLFVSTTHWGTVKQAETLYFRNKPIFNRMIEQIRDEGSLRYIDPVTRPETLRVGETLYSQLTRSGRATYGKLANEINAISVKNINIVRDAALPNAPVVLVVFNIFGRGLGGRTEAIDVEWVADGKKSERTTSKSSHVR